MLSESISSGVLDDIDVVNFGVMADGHHWMSEVFDDLEQSHHSRDDLLTDAVSEFMKFKAELPDLDLLGDSSDLLSDEIHSTSIYEDGGSRDSPDSVPQSYTCSSGYTSGFTSGASSQYSPIKLEFQGHQGQSLSVESCTPTPKKLRIEIPKEASNSDIKVTPFSQTSVRKSPPSRASVPVVSDASNRVRFIVRPNHSLNVHGVGKSDASQHAYSSFKTFSTSKSRFQLHSTESKSRCSAPSVCKNPNVLRIIRAPESGLRKQSPFRADQHSSSDSDHRDSLDDDGVAAFSEVYFDSPVRGTYEPSERRQIAAIIRPASDVSKDYGFSHTGGTGSRLHVLGNIHYGEFPENEYSRGSHLSSQHGYFRGQINPRVRSPLHLDRTDSGVLILTEEEKRTLLAEGYGIPTRLPLSKQDERNLKKIRRKIKNKISAQESRRKKKEYVEALERKLNVCVQENMDLKRRNDSLESSNRSLLGQLRLMQQLVNKSKKSTTSTQSNNSGSSSNPKNNCRNSPSGGSASTCLMMFALCFAALLVGQPTNFSPRSTLDSGLTFGPQRHNFLNDLINAGPSGLVPSSLSRIGYTWSSSDTNRRCIPNEPTKLPIFGPHWPGGNSTVNSPAAHEHYSHQLNWPDDTLSIRDFHVDTAAQLSGEPIHSPSHAPPPSVLLGSPDELKGCVAPSKPFWSYLFGGSLESEHVSICARQNDAEIITATIDTDELMNLHMNALESTVYGSVSAGFANFTPNEILPSPVHSSVNTTNTVIPNLNTAHFPVHILITA